MNKNFSLKGFQITVIVSIAVLLGYFFGTHTVKVAWKDYIPIAAISSKNPPPGQNLNMGLFYEVIDKINQGYYDKAKIDPQKIVYGAITGALASLDDPYTSFFPPRENQEFKTQLAGEFSGIGAELGITTDEAKRILVIAPLDGSPAARAGIKVGDLILKVDGHDTNGWKLAQAVEKIRGTRGTVVTLTVLHEKDKAPQDVKITRDIITIKSVTGWVKSVSCDTTCHEGGSASVAYIRLSQFGDKTNDEWLALVNNLLPKIQAAKNFRGIILDVRSNPGGYLQDAVFIASEFIKNGTVVKQEDGAGNVTALDVSRRGLLTDYPLVVLINKGSASASEIVSGALRDHGRARLLGETSFGKGTIQSAVDVDNGASVHISVGKWLTPNGTWVNKVGLKPDVEVKFDATKSADLTKFDNQLQAAIQELLK